jgi:hypothetical protein
MNNVHNFMQQNVVSAYWFQSTDCDVIDLFTPWYSRVLIIVAFTPGSVANQMPRFFLHNKKIVLRPAQEFF